MEQAESSRLAWAMVLSLTFHLLLYGGYQANRRYDLWNRLPWPAWTRSAALLTEILKRKETPPPQTQSETPLMFVDVSAAQATPEPPKNARFYSSKNSIAANPDPDKDTDTPKIGGKQTQVVKTESAPREKFMPLQPAAAAPQAQEAQEELKARSAQAPGDLAMAKPETAPGKDEGQAERARPRTIKEARARLQDNRLAGEMMKQEGGVRRARVVSSLDTKATPFGEYDSALIEAIQSRWYSLLDERDYASDSRGRVVLHFRLRYDGHISEMRVAENTAGEVLGYICQKAVMDPSPFASWPTDMRRMAGDSRTITFTFFYN